MIRQFLSLARRHIKTDKLLILRTADHISTDYGKLLYRILRPGLSLPSVIGYRFQNIMIFHINIENPLPHRYDLSHRSIDQYTVFRTAIFKLFHT